MSNVFKNNTPELHLDELDAELEDNKAKKIEAERKNIHMHNQSGIYFKEAERSKHHEYANKIEDERLNEEMAFKAQQKQNRDFSHAERVAEKDEKLQSILNKNM